MPTLHAFCHACGAAYAQTADYPRTCAACGTQVWRNPLPVGVVILPVDAGVLVVRRAIPPRQGQLALPGGFLVHGESWQQGAARELREETGIAVDLAELVLDEAVSTPDGGSILLFARARRRRADELPPFAPTEEASERLVLTRVEPLAFPLHTQALERALRR